jgi:hypothetical protein
MHSVLLTAFWEPSLSVEIVTKRKNCVAKQLFLYATMKFSSFALAAVAIAASSVNAFSASGPAGRVAQVCHQMEFEGSDRQEKLSELIYAFFT